MKLRIKQAIAAMLICTLAIVSLVGCSSSTSASNTKEDLSPVRIGTMPTEDFLPMWVAEKDNLFARAGVNVELITFDSAQALSAAIAGGEVDMAMVDVMRAAKLCETKTPVEIEWVTLGTEANQGIFGVLAPADATYSTLEELAQAAAFGDELASRGVGLAANTVPEYVYDKLCEEAGVASDSIEVQEIASLPERYSLMASGNLAAAALPASLLELGKASGMKLLADDSQGANISQSVMVAREDFANENAEAIVHVANAWNMAADAINEDPGAYTLLLAEKANLNSQIASDYPICTYPNATDGDLARIDASLVQPQLEWMSKKGYTSKNISYDENSGRFTIE